MLDQEDRLTAANFTIGKAIEGYWDFAQTPPEETRGSLKCQIEACKQMCLLGYEPALAMLDWPVRCQRCHHRTHTRLPSASMFLLRQDRIRHVYSQDQKPGDRSKTWDQKPGDRRKVPLREAGAKSRWILFPARAPAFAIARSEYTTG